MVMTLMGIHLGEGRGGQNQGGGQDREGTP
jgi:hypothetical protein